MSDKPVVIVYREQLLHTSENFILNQARSLEGFTPVLAGMERVRGISLDEAHCVLLRTGAKSDSARDLVFKLTGHAPGFVERLRALQPQLIHAHFGPDGCRALSLAEQLNVPLVTTFHGFDATVSDEDLRKQSLGRRIYVYQRPKLARRGDLSIAVSQFVRLKLLENGFDSDRVVVHYIGVDRERFTPSPLVRRAPRVLFVGRLVEVKGCEYAIRAMARIQFELPEVEFVIIGDGELRRSLEQLAAECGCSARFLGEQPAGEVKRWMNSSAVFCVPSTVAKSGATEAFGIVFAEAQAMGLPVVSFDTGGVREAVQSGSTGLLASDKNILQLEQYLRFLLTSPSAWERFSAAAQRRTSQLFDLKRQNRALENIYRTVRAGDLCGSSEHQPETSFQGATL